jgi:amino acid transporter
MGAETVEAKSATLRRELRLGDLVLAQIIFIVGSTWVGTAGKLGAQHLVLWLLASTFFFAPLAVVVIYLNKWRPLEGGLYQWAKLGFGEMIGFLVAWNLWVYAIVIMSALGLELATFLSYAFGARGAWMAKSRVFIAVATIGVVALLAVSATVGLRWGKWVHNLGGALRIFVYSMLLLLPLVRVMTGDRVEHYSLEIVAPTASLLSLNILGKMGFGAFSGFEYVAIFAGESTNPARAIGRSVIIAAPIVVAMFILGTASVAAFVRPADIDLIAPLPQALAAGARPTDFTQWLAPAAAIALAVSVVSYGSAAFSGITRLPMVAGWDGLLPSWFTRLHPTWRTPTNSIVLVAIVTVAVGLGGMTGVGEQEAYQLIASAALILYALTYLVMFALPIVAASRMDPRPPLWLRVAAASGFVTTLLFVVLGVFPIIVVESHVAFAAKISGVVVGANVVGALIYALSRRRAALTSSRDV